MAVSAKTGRKLWVADLHPLWDKANGQAKPQPALFVMGRAVVCVRVWNDTDVTILDLGSGEVRGVAKFPMSSQWVGMVQTGDSAVCLFHSWGKGEPSFQTVSLVDAKTEPGISEEAEAVLPGGFLNFGTEAFVDRKPIDIPDYTGDSPSPPAGKAGSRVLCFLQNRKQVVSVSTESYYIDDMHGPYETHRVALWQRKQGGYSRLWGFELFRPYMDQPRGTKDPVIGCRGVLAFNGQAWLFGGPGVYRVTDAGPAQVAKGVEYVPRLRRGRVTAQSRQRAAAEYNEDSRDAVTGLLVVGRKLYGTCPRPLNGVTVYEYRDGGFRPLGETAVPPIAEQHRYSARLFGSTPSGFLRAVYEWNDGDAEVKTVYEMYRLPD